MKKVLISFCISLIFLPSIIQSCKKEKVPALTTADITNLAATSATSGGTIIDEGSGVVLERGVCWSPEINPTINDKRTIEGGGAGTFISNITGLTGATIYWIRAYATNNTGTGYGMTMSLKTLGDKPVAVTNLPTNISTGVILKGTVNPNCFLTEAAFEYGTSLSYGSTITALQSPIAGDTTSSVYAAVPGLTPETTYHFRIKAVNSLGTTYGDDISFKQSTTVTDIDTNTYQTVTIGSQTWMAENLKTTRYNNGDTISGSSAFDGAYFWYKYKIENKDIYGGLYNWYAGMDRRNVCPTGWHVPSKDEWLTLVTYLGGDTIAGGKLKEAGTAHWGSPNSGATNESGFTALPGGYKSHLTNFENHGFTYIGRKGYWITSSEYEHDSTCVYVVSVSSSTTDMIINLGEKKYGCSIRCLKDQ